MSNQELTADREKLLAMRLAKKGLRNAGYERIAASERGPTVRQSSAQQRLWFMERLKPGTATYNVPSALNVRGPLDVDLLERCLNETIARHEILRTTFGEQDHMPVQTVHAALTIKIERSSVVDAADEADSKVSAILFEQARRPFDLAEGPLLRMAAVQRAHDEHVLVLTVHHIIADAWSLDLVFHEITALYNAHASEQSSPLGDVELQYADFSEWQHQWLDTERCEQQLAYWRDQVGDAPTLDLVFDRPQAGADSTAGDVVTAPLSAGVASALAGLGERLGTTAFSICLAGFNVLLSRYANQKDIVVGAPVWNRDRDELQSVMGFFVNVLPIRSHVDSAQTFADYVEQMGQTVSAALANQDLPLDYLVEHLGATRGQGRTPLFNTTFAYQPKPPAGEGLRGLDIEPIEVATQTAKFALSMSVAETDAGLNVALEYSSALFERATAERLLAHYCYLLEYAVAAPEQTVGALPLTSQADQQALIQSYGTGQPAAPWAGGVCAAIAEHAQRTPDQPAVSDEHASLTYAQLAQRSDDIARALRAADVAKGAVVAIVMDRSADMAAAMLGAMKCGAAYLPIQLTTPAQRLAAIVRDADVAAIVSHSSASWSRPSDTLVLNVDDLPAGGDAAPASTQAEPQDAAYVIYTSGSTGAPKGVAVSHGALANLCQWTARAFALSASDKTTQIAGAGFDAMVWEVWSSLMAGANVVFVPDAERAAPAATVRFLAENDITVSFLPTPMAELCLRQTWPTNTALRFLLTGGDTLHKAPPAGLPFTVINNYGPTETAVVATSGEVSPNETATPSIGRAIDGVQILVLDAEQRHVPLGVPGELYVGGASVGIGYRNNAALTDEFFVELALGDGTCERYYRTGDRVRYSDSGDLEFLGRMDEQVQIRGFRVEPGEVAAAIYAHSDIARAAVVAVDDAHRGKCLVAYVEPNSGAQVAPAALQAWLKERLADYMVPAAVVVMAELPTTVNGKIDRARLPAPDFKAGNAEPTAPSSDNETLVVTLFEEVLGLAGQVGTQDDFFALGGHSLLVIQLVSRLERELAKELPIQCVFEEPTPAGLAAGIDSGRWVKDTFSPPPLVAVRDTEGEYSNEFPQSPSQRRLWFLEQLEPGTTTYSVPAVYQIKGALNVDALRSAIDALIQRHEPLRTTFAAKNSGLLVQVVSQDAPDVFTFTNLEELAEEQRLEQAKSLVLADAATPFHLTNGPMLRVMLLRMSATEHVLLVNMHHIITDAWSSSVLMSELATLYRARCAGVAADLNELDVQYADYSKWQDEWLQYGVLEELLFYWREQLRDAPPELSLMTDRPRLARQSNEAGYVSIDINPELTAGMKAIAKRNHATLFMVTLAAFKALLARESGQDDIVIGVPVANRDMPELEQLVGFFVNTLAIRTDLSADPSFEQLTERVKGSVLGAFEHQRLPFDRLVEELAPEERWRRAPVFQILFVFQNAPETDLALGDLEVSALPLAGKTAKFDMTLSVREVGEGIHVDIEYNAGLFDQSSVERMFSHFQQLIASIVADTQKPISRLHLLTDGEQQQLTQDWNVGAPPASAHGDVVAWFEQRAAQSPESLAVVDGEQALTYRELSEASNRLAHHLVASGVVRDSVVAIGMNRSVDMAISMFGILKAGGAYLPLDINNPSERLGFIVDNGDVMVTLTRAADKASVASVGGPVICIDEQAAAIDAQPAEAPAVTRGPDDLAYVIYTSGSTGKPKGVEVEHRALNNLVTWLSRTYEITPEDKVSQLAGAAFDASLCEWWVGFSAGASVHIVDDMTRASPTDLIQWMYEREITLGFMPTPLLEAAMHEAWPADMKLRAMITGGDALRVSPDDRVPFKLLNIYGPAENACATTCSLVPRVSETALPPSIGTPIDGVHVYVLDESMALVPTGVVGELYVGGASLARGYRNNDALTRERFVADPFSTEPGAKLYRTGDQVRYRSNGELEFVTRVDDQVKIRGYRVELNEVRSALLEQPNVAEAYVMVRQSKTPEKKIVAYVILNDGAGDGALTDQQTGEIREGLSHLLPAYMMPSAIVMMDEFPKSTSGKVDRKALPEPKSDFSHDQVEFVAPADEIEESLAEIWTALLSYEPIGQNHDFFQMGGHSLLALTMKSEIFQRFGVNIQLAKLFQEGSMIQLAGHVRALLAEGPETNNEVADYWTLGLDDDDEGPGLFTRLKGMLTPRPRPAAGPKIAANATDALVPFSTDGNEAPVFFVHPIGGRVDAYGAVSEKLRRGVPVYGLQALERANDQVFDVKEMAANYVYAMQSVQPEGPYRICGWSMGGVIALEMAQQLRKVGQEVSLLGMIDAYPFDAEIDPGAEDENAVLCAFVTELVHLSRDEDALDWLSDQDLQEEIGNAEDTLQQSLDVLKLTKVLPPNVSLDEFQEKWEQFQTRYHGFSTYQPEEYPGQVSLVLAADSVSDQRRAPTRVWGRLVSGGLDIDVLPADHYGLLYDDHAIQAVADLLNDLLLTTVHNNAA